jgi:imidazole glycerol-phosphate synthase subunit HisH
MIVIADYGMGNVRSIQRMFKKIGVPAMLGTRGEELRDASALILPGVGAFDHAMVRLEETGFRSILDELVCDKRVPVLGICLGMQLLFERSEEGERPGLGWLKGDVRRFKFDESLRLPIPHMGWREVRATPSSFVYDPIDESPRFYFVHSYHAVPADPKEIAATAEYGYSFCCAVQHENIFGSQFHPEKSHRFGMRLLTRFVDSLSLRSSTIAN